MDRHKKTVSLQSTTTSRDGAVSSVCMLSFCCVALCVCFVFYSGSLPSLCLFHGLHPVSVSMPFFVAPGFAILFHCQSCP